jgi:hypothetical protein
MRSPWKRTATPSPISVGQFSGNAEDGWSLFQFGAYYQQPNSLAPPAVGTPVLSLDFGFGSGRLTLDFGGFHALAPPAPEEP